MVRRLTYLPALSCVCVKCEVCQKSSPFTMKRLFVCRFRGGRAVRLPARHPDDGGEEPAVHAQRFEGSQSTTAPLGSGTDRCHPSFAQ